MDRKKWVFTILILITPILSKSQATDYEQSGWLDNIVRNSTSLVGSTSKLDAIDYQEIKKKIVNDFLLSSIDTGHYQLVSYLLLKGADPNSIVLNEYSNDYGYSALMLAARKNHLDIIDLLIRKGANVKYQMWNGNTALFEAVKQLNDSTTNLLIKSKSLINHQDEMGLTPLQYSTGFNLLNYSQDKDYKITVDNFVNHSKANRISELLINAGANVNIADIYGYTPLIVAAQLNNISLVKILCKAGANVNAKSTDGISALIYASDNGYYEIAKSLIDFGVKVNMTAPDGNSAVFAAVRANNDSITELLIKHKAIINASNSSKLYPIHYAAGYGYPYMTNLLLSNGAKSNLTDLNGNTPLMASVYSGAIGATKILIDSGADVNLSDIDGNTPLMVAAQFNDTTLIKVLHSAGADLNVLNKNKFNALSSALMSKSNEAFKLLVDLGAKIDTSCSKESVYQQAKETKNYEISSYLKDKNLSTKLRMKIGSINFYTGFSTSQNNFMVDFGGGIYEPISNIIMNIGYKYNPYSNRVVVLKNSSFYQFWEKRHSFYLSLQHLQVIKKNWLRGNIGFTPGISNELTWNKYRGVKNGSGAKWVLVPSIGLYYQRNIFTIIGKWEFAKYSKQIKESNRFNLQLLFSIPTSKRFVNKKINWLD